MTARAARGLIPARAPHARTPLRTLSSFTPFAGRTNSRLESTPPVNRGKSEGSWWSMTVNTGTFKGVEGGCAEGGLVAR